MMRDVVVVGAGPAGLAQAFWRTRDDPQARVTVLEAAARPGGWVQSERRDGYLCESGPQAARPCDDLDRLVEALGMQDDVVPASAHARARWIGRGGRLVPVPGGPGQLLTTPLLSLGGKLRLLREPFVRPGGSPQESVAAFVRRRFGPQTEPLVQAMVAGIFGGDASRLEVASAFPVLATAEREGGSVLRGMLRRKRKGPRVKRPALCSFRGGMAGLVQRLVTALGGRVRTGTPATGMVADGSGYAVQLADGTRVHADELVLACPARASARLLARLSPDLARDLADIPYASLASVHLGFPLSPPQPLLQGFGFLLEAGEGSRVLGAIYCHSVFPDHAPPGHGLVRVMLGGVRHPEVLELSDADLVGLAVDALRRYAGLQAQPTFTHVARARTAVPQYETGHAARLVRIDDSLRRLPGLSLRGNSYRAVALTGQLARPDIVAARAAPEQSLVAR